MTSLPGGPPHGIELSGRVPSSTTAGARIACLSLLLRRFLTWSSVRSAPRWAMTRMALASSVSTPPGRPCPPLAVSNPSRRAVVALADALLLNRSMQAPSAESTAKVQAGPSPASHTSCRRAAWDRSSGTFRCAVCMELLASGRPTLFGIRHGLAVRPKRHGDLVAYGPGDRARARAKSLRGGSRDTFAATGGFKNDIFVYCPRVGCGRGQHLGPGAASVLGSP